MKPAYFKQSCKNQHNKGFILAKGKALARGIFLKACFGEKETIQ
jgi:hypothetical protein